MIYLRKLCLIVAVFYLPQAFAVTPDEVINNMQKAAATTVAAYKEVGMSALVQNSESCYQEINKHRFYCIYLDLAARHVSELDGAGVHFAPEKYFVDAEFLPRAGELFVRSSMTMDQSNEYLAIVTPLINKFVDRELAPVPNKMSLRVRIFPELSSMKVNS